MDLSVIIVSYNVRYFLNLCLFSVRKAAEGISCEIFVVDNNSSDGSCSVVSTSYPEVKLIANNDNRGFAAANNQAIKQASGRYILLLNPDTFIGEDTLRKCIAFMDNHADAGAMGAMMINGKGKFLPESKRGLPDPATAFYRIAGLTYIFPRSGRLSRYYLGHLDLNETHEIDVISGAYMFLRREAVLKTGLPDEKFFMYGEDIDYSIRLMKEGFKNYYYPEVKILHFKGESTRKENIDFVVNFYRAMLIFVGKHYNGGNFKKLSFTIRTAIFFRAGLSVMHRFFRKAFLPVFRAICLILNPQNAGSVYLRSVRTAIVSDIDGYNKVAGLLSSAGNTADTIRIGTGMNDTDNNSYGNVNNLKEILKNNRIGQVIFTAGRIKATAIIDSMIKISDRRVTIRILSHDEKFLISSGSIFIFPAP